MTAVLYKLPLRGHRPRITMEGLCVHLGVRTGGNLEPALVDFLATFPNRHDVTDRYKMWYAFNARYKAVDFGSLNFVEAVFDT